MAYQHGLYFSELATEYTPPLSGTSGVVVAVGTAPAHLATAAAKPNTAVLATKFSEAVEQLGWSEDFDKYTLCEVMNSNFSLFTVGPCIFINVLDPAKHFKKVEGVEFEGVISTPVELEGDFDTSTFVVTSGEFVAPTKLVANTDYSVVFTAEDDTDPDNVVPASTVLTILDTDAVEDNKITVSYKTTADGETIETEITLSGTTVSLPTDTILSTVTVKTGGVDTLQNLVAGEDYKIEYLAGVLTLTILDDSKILDDKIKVDYHEIDPSKVTVTDIVGGVDVTTGVSTGIELINSIFAQLRIVPGTLIAPKFSLDSRVASALLSKAQAVSGMFPAIAVIDLDTTQAKTYAAAVELKTQKNLNDQHAIVCWPKVRNSDKVYHLSTQLAALMAQTDVRNNDIPYVSPSNQSLAMDAAVLADGTEIYLTRDQANVLNGAGIVTALSFNGYRAWGNRTSVYPSSSDPKASFIPIRRMFNYIHSTFAISYLSRLDQPITRRALESIVFSGQIWLDGLVAQGALIGATLAIAENLSASDLMDGIVRFTLRVTPPSPMRVISYTLAYDADNLQTLLG